MTGLDRPLIIAVASVYLLVVLAVGFWSARRTKTAKDFWIAGQRRNKRIGCRFLISDDFQSDIRMARAHLSESIHQDMNPFLRRHPSYIQEALHIPGPGRSRLRRSPETVCIHPVVHGSASVRKLWKSFSDSVCNKPAAPDDHMDVFQPLGDHGTVELCQPLTFHVQDHFTVGI